MAEVEITDEASLEAWLTGRPKEDAEVIALRAAARVFPLWGAAKDEDWLGPPNKKRKYDFSYIVIARPILTSIVAQKYRDFQIIAAATKAATRSANNAHNAPHGNEPRVAYAAAASNVASRAYIANALYAAGQATQWKVIEYDALGIAKGVNLNFTPLWPNTPPDWFTKADAETRVIWAKDPDTWNFWVRWWDGVIAGKPLPMDLQREVALIEDEVWQQGPKAVAEAIRVIEAARSPQPARELTADQVLDRAIAKLPPAKEIAVAAVRQAVIAHRAELLENFAALQGFIALEFTRLQTINYLSDEHRDLCIQQAKTLSVIALTVERLGALVPQQAEKEPDAEKIESLGRVYLNLLQEWPRSNAREVVDTTCRLSLVGMGSAVAAGLGLPVPAIAAVLAAGYLAQPMLKVVVEGKKQKNKK